MREEGGENEGGDEDCEEVLPPGHKKSRGRGLIGIRTSTISAVGGLNLKEKLAARAGIEPATNRLTADRSTAELPSIKMKFGKLKEWDGVSRGKSVEMVIGRSKKSLKFSLPSLEVTPSLVVFLRKPDSRFHSMKQVELNVKTRDALGSTAVKRLRGAGEIPAVLYGENGVHHLQIEADAFSAAWRKIAGRASLLELHADGAEETTFAIIKEYQRNPRTDRFEHIDFQEIVRGKDMEADIPVEMVGSAFGVKNQQGVLEIHAHELGVRCRPRVLPESIKVDVTSLKVGQSLRVRDLPAMDEIVFTSAADLVVVSCVGSSGGKGGEEEAPAEAAAAVAPAATTA